MAYELVNSYEDVLVSAKAFKSDLKNSEVMSQRLGRFRHWYYFAEIDDFAPRKLIGYKGNTTQKYKYGCWSGMETMQTVPVLKEWFREVDDSEFEWYYKKLENLLSEYDRKPNKLLYFHIKK